MREIGLAFIDESLDSPELRRAVTPDFPDACKRVVVRSDDLYAALNRENVTLVPHAVSRVTESVVVADANAYDVPRALVGAVVPGFPNFFIAYGPNTNGGSSIIFQIEPKLNFAVLALKRAWRRARLVEAIPAAFDRYEAWLDRTTRERLHAQTQCNNYYISATERNVTQWPLTHGAFRRANLRWQYRGLRFTRRAATSTGA